LVDTRDGSLLRDSEAKERAAARHDYGLLADRVLVPVERHHVDREPLEDLATQHALHGWGTEDVKFVVEVMAETGAEPVYSMGDDIPIAPLGRTPRRVYGYLRQRFAQVTNPAIDPLREKAVMSLRTLLGARHGTLEPEGGTDRELLRRHHPAVPGPSGASRHLPMNGEDYKLLELESPVLGAAELARVLETATVLDATYAPDESLRKALEAGLLKVMAKMGISCVTSYRGAEVLEALGLGAEVTEMCFRAVPSRVGGADLADIERAARSRPHPMADHGRVRFRKAGEHHAYNPLAVRAAKKAAQTAHPEQY